MKELLEKLKFGGKIVSSASCSELDIAQARVCNNFWVDEDNFGFVYVPEIK